MALGLTGVFSNIDTDALVNAAISTYGQPLRRYTDQKTQTTAAQQALTDIEGRLTDLKSLADTLHTAEGLRSVVGTSSDKTIATVSTSGGAMEGAFSLTVNQLASADRLVLTSGLGASDALVGAGQFVYTYNGTTRTRMTDDETTLEGLRDLINNDGENPGITASVLNVAGTYHLVLAGENLGSDYDIAIDDGQTTLTGFDTADFTRTQTAQNAQVRVDGFPAGTWIERSSNILSDVLPGVSVNLVAAGSASVNVARDSEQFATNLENFISIYNGLVATVSELTGYDTENKTAGILQGDMTIQNTVTLVREVLNAAIPGFQSDSDSFVNIHEIGITFDRYGALSLDRSVLTEALATDLSGVLKLIGAQGSGSSDNANVQFSSSTTSTQAGAYDVQAHYDASGNLSWGTIRLAGETAWRNLDIDGDTLVGQDGTSEEGLRLTGQWAGGGEVTETASVFVQQGFTGSISQILEEMLDPIDGALAGSKTRYADRLVTINSSIERQNIRLDAMEERLRAKYARLEGMLAQLDSQRGAFESLMSSLDSNKNDN